MLQDEKVILKDSFVWYYNHQCVTFWYLETFFHVMCHIKHKNTAHVCHKKWNGHLNFAGIELDDWSIKNSSWKWKKDVFIKLSIYLIMTLFFVGKNLISRLMQQWKFPSIHVASNVSTNYYFFFRNIIVNQLCWFWCNILSLKLLCSRMQILSFMSHFMRLNARCSWNFTSLQYLTKSNKGQDK